MSKKDTETAKPRRGRPHKTDAAKDAQTSKILDVAVKLFSKQGYQPTTMSQIAQAAGYNQSSLYYWFKCKEDIVAAILKKTDASLKVATEIATQPDDKIAQLYAVLYSDMVMMCSSPFDFYDLEAVAYTSNEPLQSFFITYQQLTEAVEQILLEGMKTGEFIQVNAADFVIDALALNEGLQHRYHMNKRNALCSTHMIGEKAQELFCSIEKLAYHSARTSIVLVAPDCVPADVHQRAKEKGWI
ncbi:TetR/AcrR family transcriptional regulator [Adlercreutzia sp. ZJ138]|uniref:TetR/AcrR family transcriptional regulator n=1 Tax=Adlercreutzia sp. ZJ138 TaxID=2709405 RepID=UPI0013ED847F|nr:TetR/AcrR family transcriptional regulator [Adlercreutzia sp. ZJ138]